jgi:hypothetical protein
MHIEKRKSPAVEGFDYGSLLAPVGDGTNAFKTDDPKEIGRVFSS